MVGIKSKLEYGALFGELESACGSIPPRLSGVDRQQYLGSLADTLDGSFRIRAKDWFGEVLGEMIKLEASDIDIGGNGCCGRIWYRIHGLKRPENESGFQSLDQTDLLLQLILTEKQRRILFEKRNLDFSYSTTVDSQIYRFRGDIYFDMDHLALNFRLITNRIREFSKLGIHPLAARNLNLKHVKQGLTLVTGITGSGKSSTLDSIIDANNRTVDAHVVIISAPVETVHTSHRCIIRQREVGKDVLSFKDGTIQALRQDPDIIVIGEMRDPETIMAALEVTDSGHRVFSTLHTASAVESIDRILAECRVLEQERVRMRLADVLVSVISQKLIPSIDGGLILAKEVMMTTPSVRAAIKNNNTGEIYQMINEGGGEGMITMEQDLNRLYRDGRISRDDTLDYANNKKRMIRLLNAV